MSQPKRPLNAEEVVSLREVCAMIFPKKNFGANGSESGDSVAV
jgi:hypothetical protein